MRGFQKYSEVFNIFLGSLFIVPIGNSISLLLVCEQGDALEDFLVRYEIKSGR